MSAVQETKERLIGLRDTHYAPLFARTRSFHRAVRPAAYDCVKLVTARHGSALVFSEFDWFSRRRLPSANGMIPLFEPEEQQFTLP